MRPEDCNILDLIPQRHPMVMIDKLTYSDERSARGLLMIGESNMFCYEGLLQEAGLIEFIAQTAAAYKGFLQLSEDKEAKQGFIGSIKNLAIHSLPHVNTEIQSEIIVENELLGYIIINGRILQENTVLAECEMRILTEIRT